MKGKLNKTLIYRNPSSKRAAVSAGQRVDGIICKEVLPKVIPRFRPVLHSPSFSFWQALIGSFKAVRLSPIKLGAAMLIGAIISAPLMSAFEAHIVGVTARISQKTLPCPEGLSKITTYAYMLNGKKIITDLTGKINSGDAIKLKFIIAPGCEDVEVSFMAYNAPGPEFNEDTADQQTVFSFQTGNFSAGTHFMDIQVPECYFEVDFATGAVIEHLGPVGTDNFYGSRLIDSDNGGEEVCPIEETEEEILPLESFKQDLPEVLGQALEINATSATSSTVAIPEVLGVSGGSANSPVEPGASASSTLPAFEINASSTQEALDEALPLAEESVGPAEENAVNNSSSLENFESGSLVEEQSQEQTANPANSEEQAEDTPPAVQSKEPSEEGLPPAEGGAPSPEPPASLEPESPPAPEPSTEAPAGT